MNMLKAYRNRILAAALALVACLSAKAEGEGTYSGFSPYSVYGVGNLHAPGTSWNRGMGGIGIAARNHRFINVLNPASVTARDTLSFMADFGINGRIAVFSEEGSKGLNTTFNIDDFVISFPMWNHTAFMVGLTPMSDVGYKVSYDQLTSQNLPTGWQTFSSAGNGGLYTVFAAAGGTFWNRLSIGAQVNYTFGTITKRAAMSYESEDARAWQHGDSLQVGNVTAKLGLQYEQPVGHASSINIGATYRFSTNVHGFHTRYRIDGVNNEHTVDNLAKSGLKLGDEIGVGISYRKGDDLLIEFDYTRTDWTKSGFDKVEGFANSGDVVFLSSVGQSFRLGGEFTPNRNDIRYYMKRCTYRAGAYYESSYYTVAGSPVESLGITIGMTLPVFRWYNGLSVGLEFGRRGLRASQVKETYFGFSVGMNVFDIWFKKPHYE